MNYEDRISAFKMGDEVQIRFTDGSTMNVEYLDSSESFVLVVNENGLFAVSVANFLWIRKDLLTKGEK